MIKICLVARSSSLFLVALGTYMSMLYCQRSLGERDRVWYLTIFWMVFESWVLLYAIYFVNSRLLPQLLLKRSLEGLQFIALIEQHPWVFYSFSRLFRFVDDDVVWLSDEGFLVILVCYRILSKWIRLHYVFVRFWFYWFSTRFLLAKKWDRASDFFLRKVMMV